MIIVPVKEGDNIERALKKFKRKYEKTGIVKELRARQAFEKPSVANRKKMMRAVYVQKLQQVEEYILLFFLQNCNFVLNLWPRPLGGGYDVAEVYKVYTV